MRFGQHLRPALVTARIGDRGRQDNVFLKEARGAGDGATEADRFEHRCAEGCPWIMRIRIGGFGENDQFFKVERVEVSGEMVPLRLRRVDDVHDEGSEIGL